ncbi:beta-ketoacyl synthase N-terminal-like domain-containing protein [Streptomyces acidiscabies]|uniref:beta-ketoacyl synthase N-terminal-like domain-containing protein n=1 Tax=Streptomyces acidiscabies TaxID=42234 RepID=UPI0009A0CE52|nr:beta-ketoacyl synthase N-terminal-like domain-containing protein [Streptomyces acidiscabies]
MTHPTAGTVTVGGTAPRSLEALRPRRDLSVLAAGESLPAAFVDVLSTALDHLPAALRAGVPVIMAATDYCVAATSQYVGRCVEAEAGGRRLRPSEAMTPEPAQLLQELAQAGGWNGTGHVLISPRAATLQAVRWAWGAVAAGLHEAMVVCEVVQAEHEDGYRIAAVPVTAADGAQAPRTGEPGVPSVVVSGTGLVTAFGDGGTAFWQGLLDGRRELSELTRFDASRFRSRTVCQTRVPGHPTRRALLERARSEALREAGLDELPGRTLLVSAGVVPHLPQVADAPRIDEIAVEPDWDADGTGVAPPDAVLLAHACASGAFGLAMAREWLLCGLADTAVVTGVSSLNAYDYACLDVLRATSTTAARPFDEHRSGVTIGEGAGVIVLETAERAAARGQTPLATLSGISCRVAGQGLSRLNAHIGAACMRDALAMAGRTTVDYVHGHAPGTRQGDEAELLALDQIGAEHDWRGVPVSSYKGAAGHLLHASVFPGVVAAVRALRDQVLPGTPGLRKPLDARHVRVLRDPEPCDGIRSVLVNNFGFGGNNAAFLLTGGAAGRREWGTDG